MSGAETPWVAIAEPRETLEFFNDVISMTSRKIAHANPKVTAKMKECTAGVFSYIVLGDLDKLGAEVALAVAQADTPHRIELNWSPNQHTFRFSMNRLVTKYPSLQVEKGFLRQFPVTVRTQGEHTFLVLDMKGSTVVPAPKREKKESKGAENTMQTGR